MGSNAGSIPVIVIMKVVIQSSVTKRPTGWPNGNSPPMWSVY